MFSGQTRGQHGHTSVEVVVALFVMVTALLASLLVLWQQFLWVLSSELSQNALMMATNELNEAKHTLRQNFFAHINKSASAAPYVLNVKKNQLSPEAAEIYSEVSYGSDITGPGQVRLWADVWDMSHMAGADTCALTFSGSWSSQNTLGSFIQDPNNPVTDIDADNNYLYSATNSGTQSAEDFFILDVSDPANALKVSGSSLNTGPGLAALQKKGNYVFAANDGTAEQLHIFSVANPAAPFLQLKLRVPAFGGIQSNGVGKSLHIYGDLLFLGLSKNNGPELHIYNISNPTLPVWLGYYETNSAINAISAWHNDVFLVTASGDQLLKLDVTNPANPVLTDSFPTPGSSGQSGQSVGFLGERIFLGRAGGLPQSGILELYGFAADNFHNPTQSSDMNVSVKDIFIRDQKLFLATGDPAAEFKILSVSDLSQISSGNFAGDSVNLDCEGDKIYLANYKDTEPKLSEIEILVSGP